MAIHSQTRTVDAVTRSCYYRGADAATWHRFVRQVAEPGRDLEKDTTDSLLSLLSETEPAPPTLTSFLGQSLQGASPLVRPGYLARSLLDSTSASLPLPTLNTIFSFLNASTSPTAHTPPYLASTSEETARGLINLIDNILSRLGSTGPVAVEFSAVPEVLRWTSTFLDHQVNMLSTKTLRDASVRSTCVGKIEQFLDSVAVTTTAKSLVGTLTSILVKLNSDGNKRRPVPRLSSSIGRPDLELFIVTLYSTSPRTIQSDLSDRLSSLLTVRQRQSHFLSTSVEEAAATAFSDLFHAAVEGFESASTTRPDHVRRSILGVQLPRIVNKVVKRDEQLRQGVAQAVAELTKSSKNEMDLDKDERTSGARDLIAGLCREGLITEDTALSFNRSIPQSQLHPTSASSELQAKLTSFDTDEIRQALGLLTNEHSIQGTLSSSICDTITSHAQSSDLDALSVFCDALIQDPATLEIVLIHEEPRRLLEPIRETLDSFDTAQDNFGESNLIERYGNLVMFIQIVVNRFELADNLSYHLGSSRSFLSSWILSPSAAYTLSSLDDEGRTAVAGFIAALFGDGISDDLMHATNPRTLLRIAPTILKQSLIACQNGIVDLDSVKDALSYFLQELLSFTLPGVLQWLIGEIERTPPSPAQTAMFDILQVILFSESLPRTVLELVSMDLARLISGSPPSATSPTRPFDTSRVKRLIVTLLKKPQRLPTSTTSSNSWSDELRTRLSATAQLSTTNANHDASLVRQALVHLSLQQSPDKVASQVMSNLIALAPTLPTPQPRVSTRDQEASYCVWIQIERVGSVIFSDDSALLRSLINQVVPSSLSKPSFTSPVEDAHEPHQVDMLADIVGGALTLALSGKTDEGDKVDAVVQLDRLVHACKAALAAANRDGIAREDDSDRSPLARAFVERLSSYECFSQYSKSFSQLCTPSLS